MIINNVMVFYDRLNKIQLDITANCNASCPLCARNHDGGLPIPSLKTGAAGNMPVNIIAKILTPEVLKQLHCIEFDGNYGDSSHHPNFHEVLEYIYDHAGSKIVIDISSNGGFKDEDWWTELGKIHSKFSPYSVVVFGIDGIDNHTHQLYRRDVVYDKLIKNAQAFIDAGGSASWKFIEFEHNSHQFNDARRIAKELGFKKFESVSDRIIPQIAKDFADGLLDDDKSSDEVEGAYVNRPSEERKVGVKAVKTKFHEGHDVVMGGVRSTEKVAVEEAPGMDVDMTSKDLDNAETGSFEAEELAKQLLRENYKDGEDYVNNVPIQCKYRVGRPSQGQDQQINVEWNGTVWPCCWMPHSMSFDKNCTSSAHTFDNYYIKKYGEDFNSVYHHSMKEILSHPFFNEDLEASWTNTVDAEENPRLHICAHTCGTTQRDIERLHGGFSSSNQERLNKKEWKKKVK